jgi:hypothetical protein
MIPVSECLSGSGRLLRRVRSQAGAILPGVDGVGAAKVATLPLGAVEGVLPMAAGRWLVQRAKTDELLVQRSQPGELLVVDAQLEPVWRLPLPDHAHGTHAVTQDCSLVALSMPDHALVVDGGGQQVARFPHQPWQEGASGCCVFSPDPGYLWVTVPPRPEALFATGDELWLIDLRVMRVVDWRLLETVAAGCDPVPHPDGQTIGLSIGEGQDGSLLRWVRAGRDRIQLRFGPQQDRVLVAVHPGGGEYLTTPHSGDDPLVRHRFADDRPLEELSTADVLGTEEGWDWSAGYLTDALILASTFETDRDSGRHVLVQRAPMRLLGEVVYPGDEPPGWIVGPQQGTWLTVSDHGIHRWILETSR